MSFSKKIIFLFIITLLTYLPSFWNQFVWDDEQFIYKNQYVLNFDVGKIFSQNTIAGAGQQSDYYRPLTTLSFAVDHAIWGLHPFGFHLTNTLLHIGAGIILYLILTELKLNKKSDQPYQDTSLWISLIYLLHPLQTEAVVYINSRGDSLFAFLGMTSLYLYLLSYRAEDIKISNLKISKLELSIASIILYFLTILAKEIGIIYSGLFMLILLIQLIKSLNGKIKIEEIISYIKNNLLQTLTGLASLLTAGFYMILRSTIWNFGNTYNLYHGQNQYTSSLLIRMLTFAKINFIYFRLLLFPYPLHMERDTELVTTLISIWPWSLLIILITILIFGFYEFKKKKTGWIWFGLLWFYIGLVPVSGIIPINGLLYEHWLYIPMIGFFIILFQILALLINRKVLDKIYKYILPLIISILIMLTIRQNWIWRTPISFYNYQLKYSTSARMLNNLAMAYSEANEHQLAIEYYQKAIEHSDIYPQTHYNLANTYQAIGQTEDAQKELETVITTNPNFDLAYGPLINIYLQNEQYQQAQPLLDHLIEKYPDNLQIQLIKLDTLVKLDMDEQVGKLSDELLARSNYNAQLKEVINNILNPEQASDSAMVK